MRSFLSQILLPLPLFWILLITGYLLFIRKKIYAAKIITGAAVLLLILVSTPFVPQMLVKNLENRYPVFEAEKIDKTIQPVHILVLGGGHTNDDRLPATGKLSESALTRLTEGIRIHRDIPGSRLITSAFGKTVPHAKVLADAAVLLGVDPSMIDMQTQPKNTWMEATEYKRLFGDTNQLILVTSAIHIPRAVYLFEKAGLKPIPAPTGYMVKKDKKRSFDFWLPSSGNIERTEAAIHEYLGMLWYKIGGK